MPGFPVVAIDLDLVKQAAGAEMRILEHVLGIVYGPRWYALSFHNLEYVFGAALRAPGIERGVDFLFAAQTTRVISQCRVIGQVLAPDPSIRRLNIESPLPPMTTNLPSLQR